MHDEHRKEVRFSTGDLASLWQVDPVMAGQVQAKILDVSKNGIKLSTTRKFEMGAIVDIRLKETTGRGEIRYCIPADGEFCVGLQLHEVSELSVTPATRAGRDHS